MRNVDWSPRALADIERLDAFLRTRNPDAAERATITIRDAAEGLGLFLNVADRWQGRAEVSGSY